MEGNDRERVGGDEGEAPRQKSGVRLLNLNQVTAWRVLYNVQMYLVRTNADFAFNSLPEVHDSLQLLCVYIFFCWLFSCGITCAAVKRDKTSSAPAFARTTPNQIVLAFNAERSVGHTLPHTRIRS